MRALISKERIQTSDWTVINLFGPEVDMFLCVAGMLPHA